MSVELRPGAELRPGEILLEDAWRSFYPRGDRGRTLKELFASLGLRRAPQLPPTHALAGVSLRIAPGETVGIVGRNGAGKTSTLRVLAGIIPLQRGRAQCGGRVATLIELSAGFGREFTGKENILLSAALHGASREEVEAKLDQIIEFSELGHFIEAPIKTYSSGMLVRLGFSIAAHLEADVLLIDEVLAVGDEAFQRKCLRHIRARIEGGTTVLLVSHSPGTIEQACRRIVVLDAGSVAFDGEVAEGLDFYHRLLGSEDPQKQAARLARDSSVRLRHVSLQDADGRSRQVFEAGEALRVLLDVEVRDRASEAAVVLEIRKASGLTLFRTRTPVPSGTGGGRLCFEVPRLTMLGGDYELLLGMHEHGDTAPGIDRLLSFSVADVPNAEGVIDLRGEWAFTVADPLQPRG